MSGIIPANPKSNPSNSYGPVKKSRKSKSHRITADGLYGNGSSQGLKFNHSLGQHILKNPLIVDGIIQKAGVKVFLPRVL